MLKDVLPSRGARPPDEKWECWKCLIRGVLLRLGGTLGENGENIPVGYV